MLHIKRVLFVLVLGLLLSSSIMAKTEKQSFRMCATVSPKTTLKCEDSDPIFTIEDDIYPTAVRKIEGGYSLMVFAS